VYGEKLLMMDRGTVPKHVEFYSKNKFQKLVYLVGSIIRIKQVLLFNIFHFLLAGVCQNTPNLLFQVYGVLPFFRLWVLIMNPRVYSRIT